MLRLSDEMQEELRKFRQGEVDLASFQQWVEANQEKLSARMSPGILLKLRRGSTQKVMAAIADTLPSCAQCGQIGVPRDFSSRSEHTKVAKEVDVALYSGTLKRIPRPLWVGEGFLRLGADAYFRCVHCGSIWVLVEPEQHDNGFWRRFA